MHVHGERHKQIVGMNVPKLREKSNRIQRLRVNNDPNKHREQKASPRILKRGETPLEITVSEL